MTEDGGESERSMKRNWTQGSMKTGDMDIQSVMSMIPHRYPLLFIDRVISCSPGLEIFGLKNVTHHECSGTEGRARVLPAMLILEALAQLTVILTFKSLGVIPTGKELMFFAGIDDARFRRGAYPGDRIDLHASVIRMMPSKGIGKFHTKASVEDELVAEAVMMAAMRF